MPKIKTNSGAKKRFTLTGTGKIKRKHAFHRLVLFYTRRQNQPSSSERALSHALKVCQKY